MKISKAKLKQIIKEELEVTLTNEEAGEMFGEEVQAQLEEQEEPLNEDPSYAEALQLVGQAFAQMASTFGPVMIAGLFLKVAKDAFTKARSEDPVATQTDTDRVGDLFEQEVEAQPKVAGDVARAGAKLGKASGIEAALGAINTRPEFEQMLMQFIQMVAKEKLKPQDVKVGVRNVAAAILKSK